MIQNEKNTSLTRAAAAFRLYAYDSDKLGNIMDGNIITVTYLFVGIRELVPISCKNACRFCLVAILLPVESAQVPVV